MYLDQLASMLKADGYQVDQGVGAQAQISDQFAGLFAVKKDNLHTALGEVAWQRTDAPMCNSAWTGRASK